MAGETYLSSSIKKIMNNQRIQGKKDPGLTEREKEVLRALSEGLTSNEIAGKLFISLNTVKTHRRHLLRKLDVKNVTSLIKIGKDLGII